ncbi:MAG: dihydrodipicolinate synthase family protein [Bryobacteraceae bacterium]
MRTARIETRDWAGVLPVPPLARKREKGRELNFPESEKIVRHMTAGGVTRLLYGGNAFLYHISLSEYADLVGWLAGLPDDLLVIPSVGPSYGRALDQAPLLRRHGFPIVMVLPCADPRDALGLEQGYRDIADAIGSPLLAYLKDEGNFGADKEAGLDAVARLVSDGVCVGIKYAVVRDNPRQDSYLDGLLRRVDRSKVISGIGERPAIVHMRDFGLPGFTTGSGCLAPRMSVAIHSLCVAGRYEEAEALRVEFLAHEDLRDDWGPARVLHASTELAGIAAAGGVLPYVSELPAGHLAELGRVAQHLVTTDARFVPQPSAQSSKDDVGLAASAPR